MPAGYWDDLSRNWDDGLGQWWDLGVLPVTPPGGGVSSGYVRWSGRYPSWFEKRFALREEAEKQLVKRKAFDTSNVVAELEEDPPEALWADLGALLRPYGDHLKEDMSGLDLFLIAQNAKQAREALKMLQIQLEDEIILLMAANA